jgi:hypothetical protein
LVNQDAHYIHWPWSDQEFAARMQIEFASRIETLDRDNAVDRIVVVTHTPIFKDAIVHVPDDPQWNFGAAYAFNLTIGRIVAPKMKVRHVISGHSDIGGQWEISFGHNIVKTHIVEHAELGPVYIALEM